MSYKYIRGDPILDIDITNSEKALPVIDKLLERTLARLHKWRQAHTDTYREHVMHSNEQVTIQGVTTLLDNISNKVKQKKTQSRDLTLLSNGSTENLRNSSKDLRKYSASNYTDSTKQVRFMIPGHSRPNVSQAKQKAALAVSLSDATLRRMKREETRRRDRYQIIGQLKSSRQQVGKEQVKPETRDDFAVIAANFRSDIDDLCNQIIDKEKELFYCGLRSELIKNEVLQERLGMYLDYLCPKTGDETGFYRRIGSMSKGSSQSLMKLSLPVDKKVEQASNAVFCNPVHFNQMVQGAIKLTNGESIDTISKMVVCIHIDRRYRGKKTESFEKNRGRALRS